MNLEADLDEVMTSNDWAEVFGEGAYGGITDKETQPVAPGVLVDTTPPNRTDIAQVIASVNGENDTSDWIGLFLLKDGRYLVAKGGCDYTGWD